MKRMRGFFPVLALVLALTACGAGKESLLLKAADLPAGTVLLTVDGREVEAERYLYWLACACDQIAASHESEGTQPDWQSDVGGQTLDAYAKAQALANTVLYATVENWAEQYGCRLTETDRADMESAWEEMAAAYGGEEAYLAALERMGLDRAGAEALSETHYLYRALWELSRTPESALYGEEAEIRAWGREAGLIGAAWLRIPLGDDAEGARAAAAEAFAALNESADPAEAFAGIAEQYGGDGSGEGVFRSGDGTLPDACASAAEALDEGQWSGILEADGGLYILLRMPLDLEKTAAAWFDAALEDAAAGAEVEAAEAYQTLCAEGFYQALTQARTGLEAPAE